MRALKFGIVLAFLSITNLANAAVNIECVVNNHLNASKFFVPDPIMANFSLYYQGRNIGVNWSYHDPKEGHAESAQNVAVSGLDGLTRGQGGVRISGGYPRVDIRIGNLVRTANFGGKTSLYYSGVARLSDKQGRWFTMNMSGDQSSFCLVRGFDPRTPGPKARWGWVCQGYYIENQSLGYVDGVRSKCRTQSLRSFERKCAAKSRNCSLARCTYTSPNGVTLEEEGADKRHPDFRSMLAYEQNNCPQP